LNIDKQEYKHQRQSNEQGSTKKLEELGKTHSGFP
jgi:hypothetical protein